MSKQKITVDTIIDQIVEEQQSLKQKKAQVKELIEKLSVSLKALENKSYRGMSHLTGEVIKSLVTAHDLDIKLSNTLLKSYDQLARLLREVEASEEISYDLLQLIHQHIGNFSESDIADTKGVGGTDE